MWGHYIDFFLSVHPSVCLSICLVFKWINVHSITSTTFAESFHLWYILKFQLVHHDTFYNGQNQQDSNECLLMLINIIHKGSMPDSSSTTYPMGASLSDILFSFVLEKYIVCDVCGLRSPTDTSSMKTWFYKDCNRNCKNPVLDVIRTLGTSNQAIYYNFLNIYFSWLIDLDTLIIMSLKIDAPYLWIRPWDLVPLNLAYGIL